MIFFLGGWFEWYRRYDYTRGVEQSGREGRVMVPQQEEMDKLGTFREIKQPKKGNEVCVCTINLSLSTNAPETFSKIYISFVYVTLR